MSEPSRAALEAAKAYLATASEHVQQCALVYGEARVHRGVPASRDWAAIPLCRALHATLEALEAMQQRLDELEARLETPWPVAGLRPPAPVAR
ncbi:MAG: hypothetical protein IT204_11910 [Fimbriimonadaceae bacterium]|nr:hypothetical protein [Fimbriimonadaceae bacterium]